MKKTKLIAFITAFFIIFIFSLLEYFKKHDHIDITSSFDIFSTISPLFLLIILAFKLFSDYLDDSNKSSKENIKTEVSDLNLLKDEIKKIKNERLNQKLKITNEEKEDILNKLNAQFENNITQNYLENIEKLYKQKEVEEATAESRNRILREIESLKKRGTINLFLGMCLSIFGLFFLASVIFTPIEYESFEQLLINITPRTLLVIFIEIFSFFFLNLYKKSLDEVKYFQNEMTNLEGKYLALYLAKQVGNFKLLSNALDTLLKTERNFILKKDETTIELEKNRIETQGSNNTIQALKDIISFKK